MTILQRTYEHAPRSRGRRRARGPQIRLGTADDFDALQQFLTGLSADTLYLRFLAGVGSGVPPTLARRLLAPAGGGSLLALDGSVVVGHAMWAPIDDLDDPYAAPGPTADIGVVVADTYQGHGIGARLVERLAAYAALGGHRSLHAVVSTENHVVRRMIAARTDDAHYARDGAELTVTLRLPLR